MNDAFHPSLIDRLRLLARRCSATSYDPVRAPAVWLVDNGNADVFIVSPEGVRHFLCSAVAGQAMLLPGQTGADGWTLALAPGPGATIATCQVADFAHLLDTAPHADAVACLNQIAEAVPSVWPVLPDACIALAGDTTFAAPEAVCVSAGGSGLWAELTAGAASYAGLQPCVAPCVLPLPPGSWLALQAGAGVTLRTAAALRAQLPVAPLLEALATRFQVACLQSVAHARQRQRQELERLQRQRELNGQAMAGALGNLASLVGKRGHEPSKVEASSRLLAACRLVGAHAGITFQAPPPSAQSGPPGNKLQAIVRASNVRHRMVILKGAWWRHDNGALLAWTQEDGRPLALLPQSGGGYQAFDAATGESIAVDADTVHMLAPTAYMFYRSLPATLLKLSDLLRFIGHDVRQDVPAIIGIALASTLLGMAIPLASGHLFDSVFPAADRNQMVQVVLILFSASLATLLLESARAVATLRIEGKAGSSLQAAVWDRVLKLPVPFFRDYTAGDLATRINGINEIRQALSGNVIATIINSVFSLCNVVLLLYYSLKLGLVAIALVMLATVVNVVIGYVSLRAARAAGNVQGKLAGQVFEYLSGIAKLRMTGAEERAFANWAAKFAEHKRHTLREGHLGNISAVFGAMFPVVASAILFASIAGMLADKDAVHLSSGEFIAFNSAWTVLLGAALSLVRTGTDLLSIAATYERAQPLLEARPEVDDNQADPGQLTGAIELSHVSFAYAANTPPVLDDVSLSIRAGEFVALVGPSGSGKSTLLRILLGFEQPSHGGIYYDGHLLSDVNISSLRRQLGVVLQSGRVTGGDIYSNIVGASTLTIDDAWAAARACGLEADIQAMPMGMHTIVSDGGGTLSGGQRQRLLIARAMVHRPRILYFDEATSALDNRSQAIVSESMEHLHATRVVIAHRLSTIRNADRIYVLDRGRIVEAGNYEELMAREGMFAELARRQLA